MLPSLLNSFLRQRTARHFSAMAATATPSFQQVVDHFQASKKPLTNDEKLEFYGLYKVATVGAVEGAQPSRMSFVKRAKWDAWETRASTMDQQQAEKQYMQRACELMEITLEDINTDTASTNGTNPPTDAATGTAETTKTAGGFRHRTIREICGINTTIPSTEKTEETLLERRAKEYNFLSINVEKDTGVAVVNLSRADKMNAMSIPLWEEVLDVFQICSEDPHVKCVVLGADGSHFCSGMDLGVFVTMGELHEEETCDGRKRENLSAIIQYFQDGCSAPEHCTVPVLAAIHGNAVGGAIDLLTSCDMRYCVNDSLFCVKEVDLGIVADVGTTQRLPTLVGDQRARELTYTGRSIDGLEAEKIGLVLDSFETKEEMLTHVMSVARNIAAKSPLTIRGIKQVSLYNRDHPNVEEGLQHVKAWNTSYLYSEDLMEAAAAMMTKREPNYTKF